MAIYPTYQVPTAVTNIPDLMTWTNGVTGGWFGIVSVMVTFFVCFQVLAHFRIDRAGVVSLFVTGLFALLLLPTGIISPMVVIAVWLILAAWMAMLFLSTRDE